MPHCACYTVNPTEASEYLFSDYDEYFIFFKVFFFFTFQYSVEEFGC